MKIIFFLFLLAPLFAIAQDKSPIVEGISPGLYITHKVAPKENYYSIGRIYNISPKDIAPFNNLQLENGLTLGQGIKIPLNSTNFFQSGMAAADETFVPVYYAVKGKEGLYRVALNHNDLPLETLKQWNNIKGDAVKNGTRLVIGYLKVKTALSSLAKNGIGTSIGSTVVATVKTEETKIPVAENPTPAVKESQKETAKPAETVTAEPKKTTPVRNTVGTFKNQYQLQVKNSETADESGTAGIFKSSSGWTDKKYYCLHNSASQGTIIKITNPANGKFVFAKVLDLMPDIKQNEGLLIAISNAAADELGAGPGNFNCSINYSK
ncbi:MAG: LysM peptidoglycan-binding domain-containing protein [Ferruginibacter sp.]